MTPAISIMMVTYNRLDLTKKMMQSLQDTVGLSFRLIVVDNGSKDGTVDWLKQLSPDPRFCQGVHTHFFEENQGIAIGRNQGLLIANKYKDPYLCTVDNDVEFPHHWDFQCIAIMQANPKYSIGVCFEEPPHYLHPLTRNGQTFQYKSKGNLGTACMMFDRELHDKIGYFTTEYERYGEEDANWGFRARLAGYNLGYITQPGKHLGVSELDTGEYRTFKDECRKKNVAKFQQDCYAYSSGKKPIYIPYIGK
jgi:GT2 family glycosyltransferase